MAIGLDNSGFSDALVILGAAGLVIPAFARVRVTPVVGFILVGLIVGPAGLGALVGAHPWLYYVTISDPHAIEPFAEFGIVLLLFSIGLELSFRRLWSLRREVFGLGAAQLLSAAAMIAIALHLIGQSRAGAVGLGLALSLSSTALVLPMVGTTSAVGRPAFAMLLFQDLALVPIVIALGAMAPGNGAGLAGLGRVLLVGGVTVAALFVGGRFVLPRLFAQAARTKNSELFLAASLLVVIVASLATAAAGLSPIVGAMLAGILIAETPYHDEVEAITKPFQGLALGVFLITVGMGLDLRLVLVDWLALLSAVIGIVAVKAVATLLLLRIWNVRPAVAVEAGLLMGSPGETTLIVLGVAGTAQLIHPATTGFWQTATALGMTLTPLLARLGEIVAQRVERRSANAAPALAIDPQGPGTVVIGFGRVGRLVTEMLATHGRRYLAIDSDIDLVEAARRDDLPVLFGDVARAEFVDRLMLGHAEALVLTMDDPVQTVMLTRRVRGWVPGLTIVARARDADHAAELYKAGVTEAVPETLESSLQLSEAVLVELGVAMGPVIASIHDKRDQLRKTIRDAAALDREPRIRRVRRQADTTVTRFILPERRRPPR